MEAERCRVGRCIQSRSRAMSSARRCTAPTIRFARCPRKSRPTSLSTSTPSGPVAKLVVGDQERVLAVGEWSDWLPVDFDLRVPFQSVRGMGRFYLKQMKPYVEVYVSPINFDPMSPAMPVSEPEDYAAELATATGRFYTQGMPEDTKGLRTRRPDAGRVPRSGSAGRRREPGAISLCARSVRRRAALLLFRQRGSDCAHDVARQGSWPSGARSGDRSQVRGCHRRALRRSRPNRRRNPRRHRPGRHARRAVRPRLHLVAAIVPSQHMAQAGRVS